MKINEIITEKLIPQTKPMDYQLVPLADGGLETTVQVGANIVNIQFTNGVGVMSANKKFAPFLKPGVVVNGKFASFNEIGFSVGTNADDMTDAKNTGDPNRNALKIGAIVAYVVKETVYAHRSKLPFIYFWGRSGENRDKLYAKLAAELTTYFKGWGYVKLNPATTLTYVDNGAHLWCHSSLFNNRAEALTHPEFFV